MRSKSIGLVVLVTMAAVAPLTVAVHEIYRKEFAGGAMEWAPSGTASWSMVSGPYGGVLAADNTAGVPADSIAALAAGWDDYTFTLDVKRVAGCSDGLDNDGDGFRDFPHDPGCASSPDEIETDIACSNGHDDDGDGAVDFPEEPGCLTASDSSEADPATAPACADGVDTDADGNNTTDGLADYPTDPGCAFAADADEADPPATPACADDVDNDNDTQTDFPDDLGCAAAADDNETNVVALPQCGDGLDNDGDTSVDLADGGCASANDTDESEPGPAVGIAWRVQGAAYFAFQIRDGAYRFAKPDGLGGTVFTAFAPLNVDADRWNRITVQTIGDSHAVTVNNRYIATLTNATNAAGGIGATVAAGAKGLFDNAVVVEALLDAAPPDAKIRGITSDLPDQAEGTYATARGALNHPDVQKSIDERGIPVYGRVAFQVSAYDNGTAAEGLDRLVVYLDGERVATKHEQDHDTGLPNRFTFAVDVSRAAPDTHHIAVYVEDQAHNGAWAKYGSRVGFDVFVVPRCAKVAAFAPTACGP